MPDVWSLRHPHRAGGSQYPESPLEFTINPVCKRQSVRITGYGAACGAVEHTAQASFQTAWVQIQAPHITVALNKLPNFFVPQFPSMKWGEYTEEVPGCHLVYPCPSILSGAQVSQRNPSQLRHAPCCFLPFLVHKWAVTRLVIGSLHLTDA